MICLDDISTSHEARSTLFTHIFLVAEYVNEGLAKRLQKDPEKNNIFKETTLTIREDLVSRKEWPLGPELANQLLGVGISKRIDKSVLDQVFIFLLEPHKELPKIGGRWSPAESEPYRENVSRPERFTQSFRFLNSDELAKSAQNTTQDSTSSSEKENIKGRLWDICLDPTLIMQSFLIDSLGAKIPEEANFYIQTWIRKEFKLKYSADIKYSLFTVSRRVNKLFYGREVLTTADLHTRRSKTLSASALVDQIAGAVDLEAENRGVRNRFALGVMVFLLFCRVLRYGYFWPEAPLTSTQEADHPPPLQPSSGSWPERWQCFSGLSAIQMSYILSRMFGSIGEIQGLNFIFRGAILPRVDSGRALLINGPPGAGKTLLALQKLVGIASRGGLAIYFSFEESYELIVDRLVVFGLVNNSRFDILDTRELQNTAVSNLEASGADTPSIETLIQQEIVARSKAPSRRGVLVLYSDEGDRKFPLLRAIKSIAKAGMGWKWKALAIDSVNALDFDVDSKPKIPVRQDESVSDIAIRRRIQSVIDVIESQRFLGVLVSEQAGRRVSELLPYLCDTIIELSFEEENRSRWLEIKKCRSQNFHSGKHPCRLVEACGLRVYPSVASIRSSLRKKAKSTLSEVRRLPLPSNLPVKNHKIRFVAERSAVLLYGPSNSHKTDFALEMAMSEPAYRHGSASGPDSMLVITFRTTERHFEQEIRAKPSILNLWKKLRHKQVRWYSPGDNLSGPQVLAAIREHIRRARRMGLPLERIVFDELESVEHVLPQLHNELFWSTLVQLMGAEGISAIFVFGQGFKNSKIFRILQLEADYVFRVGRVSPEDTASDSKSNMYFAEIEKQPDLPMSDWGDSTL